MTFKYQNHHLRLTLPHDRFDSQRGGERSKTVSNTCEMPFMSLTYTGAVGDLSLLLSHHSLYLRRGDTRAVGPIAKTSKKRNMHRIKPSYGDCFPLDSVQSASIQNACYLHLMLLRAQYYLI